MKFRELKKYIDQRTKIMRDSEDPEVVISIIRPGSVVGASFVKVQSVQIGSDWNAGKFIIMPEDELTLGVASCPPCTQDCDQGRKCPERVQKAKE